MGTRGDFYVGRGKDAEWIGSIAYDAFVDSIQRVSKDLFISKTEKEFRGRVHQLLKGENYCEHSTSPEQGWPWPWENSQTTDCPWAFFDGKVHQASRFYDPIKKEYDLSRRKCVWIDPLDPYGPPLIVEPQEIEFPNMTHLQKIARDRRSGILLLNF